MTPINLIDYKSDITSQYGENGIIKKIFETISTNDKCCVEFGGYDLREFSNIFPLWSKDGWNGVIIEGEKPRFKKINRDYDSYVKNFNPEGSAKILNKYVQPNGPDRLDNILNTLDINKNFDLLSIDIDSYDYYVWKSLECYKPRVVIVEINETIPPHISMRGKISGNYVGTGIYDMCKLGNEKGYDLVACTVTNAIFVNKEESEPFANKNDTSKLFDFRRITYAMSAADGCLFFSQRPTFRYFNGINFISKEFNNIENKSNFWRPTFKSEFAFLLQHIIRRLFPSLYNRNKTNWARKFSH